MVGFDVGDLVRIRDWDDMVEEFGLDEYGDIDCDAGFTTEMQYLCGKTFTIEEVYSIGTVDGHETGYTITTDMIEKVCENPMGFHVGERVRIRQWDDMASESQKVRSDGAIWVDDVYFVSEMSYLCGREFVISKIEKNRVYGLGEKWKINTGMIERVEEEEPINIEDVDCFLNFINK